MSEELKPCLRCGNNQITLDVFSDNVGIRYSCANGHYWDE